MDSRGKVRLFVSVMGLFLVLACAQTPKNYESPKGYDFNSVQRTVLPDVLHELSGITFSEDGSDLIFANEDENGKVYFFLPDDLALQEVEFGRQGDYEGIAISNGYVIVLESKGTVHTFPYSDIRQKKTIDLKMGEDLIPNGEYESLAAASKDSLLYVLCKKCKEDKGSTTTSGYMLGLSKDGEVLKKGEFKIDGEQIDRFSSLKGKSFRPSALALNTRTREWYILSSINKMLVTANERWEITGAYPLNPSLFNQPESIAFDRDGNLYIGNEGGDKTGNATLLKFKRIH